MESDTDLILKVAEAHARLDVHDNQFTDVNDRLDRHEQHIAKLTDIANEIRTAQATMATKDDIKTLSNDIRDRDIRRAQRDEENMRRAFESIPGRWMVILTALLVIVTIVPWLVAHFHN